MVKIFLKKSRKENNPIDKPEKKEDKKDLEKSNNQEQQDQDNENQEELEQILSNQIIRPIEIKVSPSLEFSQPAESLEEQLKDVPVEKKQEENPKQLYGNNFATYNTQSSSYETNTNPDYQQIIQPVMGMDSDMQNPINPLQDFRVNNPFETRGYPKVNERNYETRTIEQENQKKRKKY